MTADVLAKLNQALSDRYRLERELGAGGMATVYLAHDVKHERQVAIKVLRDDLTASLGAERFVREISIAAGLTHPHILPLHDSGQAGGRLFYVMPFVDGQSLRQRLGKSGELPIVEAVRILRDVADAMAHAHQRGVVHRDLKPENIMLTGRHALVTDFGVAKAVSEATGRQTLTTAGVALGTPAYMSPEQATADPHADHRSDIYSFGVMAYELLAGLPPFVGRTPQEVLAAQVTTAAVPVSTHRASIPPMLAALVMHCLEKKPADRPQSAEELLPVLEALMTPSGGITPTGTAPWTAAGPASGGPFANRINRRVIGLVVATVVVIAAVLGAWRLRAGSGHSDARIVVAWLDNHTGDTSLANLGSLAAEWITDGLTREATASVVPSSVVRELMSGELKGSSAPIAELIKRLGPSLVISGRVDRRGDSLEYRLEARDLSLDKVIATFGPIVGTREKTDAFEQLKDQVIMALDTRRVWGNQAQWQRPTSLRAYREYATGVNDYFLVGRQRASIPYLERTIAMDSMWLEPRTTLMAAYGNADDYVRADSVRLASQHARAAAPLIDQLYFDWVAVRQAGDHEGQYRVGKRIIELDPNMVYQVTLPAARTGRAREVLKYAATADTTLQVTREWRGNYFVVLWAHHALGDFEAELKAAQVAVGRLGLDLGTATYVIRPLAAMGRHSAVDSVYALVKDMPVLGGSTSAGTLTAAGVEYLAHGWDAAQVRRMFTLRRDYYLAMPDSQRQRFRGAIAQSALLLGALADARVRFDSLVKSDSANIDNLGQLGITVALQGDLAEARRIDAALAAVSRPRLFEDNTVWRSRIAAVLGDCANAARLLRQAMPSQNYSDRAHHYWLALGKAPTCREVQDVLKPRD
jgi:hypothetical protein